MRSAAHTQPEVRQHILAQAEILFRSMGYAKTTVADIARVCAMSPANVYRFFESKVAIRSAITEVLLSEQENQVARIARSEQSAAERLVEIIMFSHRYAVARYTDQAHCHELVVTAMNKQWSVIEAHVFRMRGWVKTVIMDGHRAGEWQVTDLDTLSDCVNNAIMPFCHPQTVCEFYVRDNERQVTTMCQFIIKALKQNVF